jgi:DNA mismatch repair protein MutL
MTTEATANEGQPARIALLPENVRNQIAAGEVIERPASIVKELVENALDAGARRIEIELEEGGTALVRVRDDGSGMVRADLELAFVAHATSKLREVSDLEHIGSLGFRGEALASMGAVARCRISTRRAGDATGFAIENDNGRLGGAQDAGGPVGTSVEVRDLFHHVPARKRFLKRASTELARCLDVVQRLALAHAGVGFVVTHDGSRVYDVDAAMDLHARIRRTFGAELAGNLVAVQGGDRELSIAGFVAPPRLARADASRQMWFLNGRPLKDKLLARALKESFRGFMFENRQPVAFLALSIEPARVDVNVHPTKAEVRFRDERTVFGLVVHSVREALRRADLATPGLRMIERARSRDEEAGRRSRDEENSGYAAHTAGKLFAGAVREPMAVFEVPLAPSVPPAVRAPSPGASSPAAAAASPRSGPRESVRAADDELGRCLQIARTYILREISVASGGGFEIIDQHALHERVTFEGLMADLRAGRAEMQRYLVPEIVECSRAEVALVGANAATLARIGVEVAAFGESALAVHGLPARLQRPNPGAIVREVIAVLDSARSPRPEDILEEVLHRAACRSSVMAGDVLTQEEMQSLLARGAALESDQTCVHGRPTRVRFTNADLEKAFHRR